MSLFCLLEVIIKSLLEAGKVKKVFCINTSVSERSVLTFFLLSPGNQFVILLSLHEKRDTGGGGGLVTHV